MGAKYRPGRESRRRGYRKCLVVTTPPTKSVACKGGHFLRIGSLAKASMFVFPLFRNVSFICVDLIEWFAWSAPLTFCVLSLTLCPSHVVNSLGRCVNWCIVCLVLCLVLPCPPMSRTGVFSRRWPFLGQFSVVVLFVYCTSLACPVFFAAVISGHVFFIPPSLFLYCHVVSFFRVRIVVRPLLLDYNDISRRGTSRIIAPFPALSPRHLYVPAWPVSIRRAFSRIAVSCRVVYCGDRAGMGSFPVGARPVLSFDAMSCFVRDGLSCCVSACLASPYRASKCVEMFLGRYANVTPCHLLFSLACLVLNFTFSHVHPTYQCIVLFRAAFCSPLMFSLRSLAFLVLHVCLIISWQICSLFPFASHRVFR